MLNAERFKEEINKHNNEFGLADNIVDCGTLGCRNCRFSRLNNSDGVIIMCSTRKVKWLLSEYKEPIKLTRTEYSLLRHVYKLNYKYIARDKDGDISLYLDEPDKDMLTEIWHGKEYEFTLFNNLFPFIKWEDKEPILIKEVLNNCEVVEDAKR